MTKIVELALSFIIGYVGVTAYNLNQNSQKPQNPPAVKVVDFKHIGNIDSFNPGGYPSKLFKYDLPNKNGYLAVIMNPNGNLTTTYIPREVTWEIK